MLKTSSGDKKMTSPSPNSEAEIPGVKLVKSGKWLARTWHPTNKVWVLLGTYSSYEEAANAYARKKLEYESLSVQKEIAAPSHTSFTDFEKHPGVRLTASGKWGASIKRNRVAVWLGTYNTPKEAADAYNASKLEYESQRVGGLRKLSGSRKTKKRKHHGELKSDSQIVDANTAQEEEHACFTGSKRLPGSIYLNKAGKWKAEIQVRKVKHHLGAYATAEDAKEALNRKRRELGLVVQGEEPSVFRQRSGGPRHVHLRKNGRWQSEIKNPVTKARVYLGTFGTAEEALEAYNKKRREFDLMLVAQNGQKQLNDDCRMGGKDSKKSTSLVDGKSDSTCEEETGGSIDKVDDQNKSMLFSESKGETDLGIIDNYGRLVGEYSRLDDELWLC